MKLTLIGILICFMQVSATVYSQSTKFSFELKEKQVVDVLREIENSSNFRFFYQREQVDVERKVNINVNDNTVEEILNALFNSEDIKYKVLENDLIILTPGKINYSNNLGSADQGNVTGTVKDERGVALPGVTVLVKGTTQGTVTDMNGNYSISALSNDAVLVFSFIGMLSQEVKVEGQSTIDVVLSIDAIGIEEVVAIGYGTIKKANLTGAIANVDAEELSKRPVVNAASMLQGKLPGLRVVQNSGEPGGEGISMRVRGMGTFSGAGVNPLVIVDGIAGSISDLNPNDIESVTVLKDAASAAIYGARAANGVLLVQTKKGKEGRMNIEYQFNYAIHTPSKMFTTISNSAEYMELWNEAAENSGVATRYSDEIINAYRNATDRIQYPNFDWVDHMFNPAPTINQNVSFNGGKGGTHYNISLGYVDQEGVMKGFDYKKYNIRFNLGSQVHKRVKIGANIGLIHDEKEAPRQGASDMFLSTLAQAPTYGPTIADGSGRYTFKAYNFERNNKNPHAIAETTRKLTKYYGFQTNAFMDVNLSDKLTWSTKAAVNGYFQKAKDFRPEVPLYNYHTGDFMTNLDVGGRGLGVTDNQRISKTFYSHLTYENTFADKHLIKALVGYNQEDSKFEQLYGYRKNFPNNILRELNAGGADVQNASGTANEWAIQSLFGRLSYNFDEKYLLEANMRYDGTSRMPEDYRWGVFPSFSAAWRISEEGFLKELGWFDNAKIRGSWGKLGNQNIGLYPYQDLIALSGNYPFGSTLSSGAKQTKLTNKRLKWEETTSTNIGLDLAFLGGKMTFTGEWYSKLTTGILRGAQIPGIVGLGAPTINDGEMKNTGVELDLRYFGSIKEFKYSAGLYFDKYKNELVKFGERNIRGNTILEEGRPWDTFYMLEHIGIFQSEAEIASHATQPHNPQPGDLKFKDQNGDGKINADDRTYFDGQHPDFEYSMNFNGEWKNFDFSIFLQGVEGRKVYVHQWGLEPFAQGSPPTVEWRNRWTPENPSQTMPRIYIWGSHNAISQTSSYFLKDASYLRLKNVQVGYTLPGNLVEKIGINSLRVYFSGDNLLTFTNYPGLDPERSGSGRYVNYPQNKIFSFGVNVRF